MGHGYDYGGCTCEHWVEQHGYAAGCMVEGCACLWCRPEARQPGEREKMGLLRQFAPEPMSAETDGDRQCLGSPPPAEDKSRGKTWIRTFTLRRFDLLDPRPECVFPEDLAHHLACLNRFTGATRRPVSVAEHCVRVSRRAEELVEPAACTGSWAKVNRARFGLLHDAGEAYYNDMARPLKYALGMDAYRALEKRGLRAVLQRFGMLQGGWTEAHLPPEVDRADDELLYTERRDLLCERDPEWDATARRVVEPLVRVRVEGWGWEEAERRWLERFRELFPDWRPS